MHHLYIYLAKIVYACAEESKSCGLDLLSCRMVFVPHIKYQDLGPVTDLMNFRIKKILFNDSRNCSIADNMSPSFEEIVYLYPEGLIPLRVQGIVNHPGFRDSCVP